MIGGEGGTIAFDERRYEGTAAFLSEDKSR
ncbi:hypothetical protein KCTC52924_00561 [Arenibacter antarcticus]